MKMPINPPNRTASAAAAAYTMMALLSIILLSSSNCNAFSPPTLTTSRLQRTSLSSTKQPRKQQQQQQQQGNNNSPKNNSKNKSKRKPKYNTIADMMKAMEKNPNEFLTPGSNGVSRAVNANGRFIDTKKKPKRTRARVDRPKQKYVYASQRSALEMDRKRGGGGGGGANKRNDGASIRDPSMYDDEGEDAEEPSSSSRAQLDPQQQQHLLVQQQQLKQLEFARSLGLNPTTASQLCAEPIVGSGAEDVPGIIASIRVDDGDGSITSNSFAFVIYKPVGWSILGGNEKKKKKKGQQLKKEGDDAVADDSTSAIAAAARGDSKKSNVKRVKAYDEETDEFGFVEYNEDDILAVLTPEERAQLMKEGGLSLFDDLADEAKGALAGAEYDDGGEDDFGDDGSSKKKKKKNMKSSSSPSAGAAAAVASSFPRMQANIDTPSRPSLVNWLKQLKAEEGTPIKGGKNWVALAGATEIDDSGLVLLCPKDRTRALHVDRCGYTAVVGNGKKLTSRSKLMKLIKAAEAGGGEVCDGSTAKIEILARLKKGRDVDPVLSVGVEFPDGSSTCSQAVLLCQDRLGDGVRGDESADPIDRRAARRLVHCNSMTVSSLTCLDDEPVVLESNPVLPDDIAIYANRRDGAEFRNGSYLGRQSGLAQNEFTNAYREINGASDGYPGWIVDRYDKWLFVQHEEGPMTVRGPLPSLHDGYTTGVYYLPTKVDRSVMGEAQVKPQLLEGKFAPENTPIVENGVTYLVNLGESYSTGIFLDQRIQRAWLADNCNEETRVLNCFAHTGAFSVAAATAGASTVSLDLDKKWLDRIRPQMEANGITEWDGKHDCIYGDCFDWLARLGKRGEQFDIVILDPPSTSVGKKKRRWSVKNDMDELVTMAAALVKSGGLLFTTTNSASLRPEKFAKMCKKGLVDAGIPDAKLEQISPMPSDFPSIGAQPVTNFAWRIPE
mmetsp:Transcript_21022/g.41991  ORF Transcript_21022/g.41991 Transcript_21022/m.41991 type:complete len:951 (+) Transcript_21022:207-3059(+)